MKMLVLLLATIVCLSSGMNLIKLITGNEETNNERPIIGILTQEMDFEERGWPKNATSISAAYIKFIESVGGRVIPIHFTHTFEHVENIMNSINGILFTGGDLNLTDPGTGEFHPYTKLANFILNKAIEMNKNGNVFPLWGTWQGHQLMMLLGSQNSKIIQPTPRWYFPDNLKLNKTNLMTSELFRNFSTSFIDKLETMELTYNIHNYGIHLDDFYKEKELSSMFKVIATNIDDNGIEYLSITEAYKYPFYTVQFHPERNLYNYVKPNSPHSVEAGELTNLLAQRFIQDAKRSKNSFKSHEETMERLIQKSGIHKMYSDILSDAYYFVSDFP